MVANDFAGKISLVKHFTENNRPDFDKLLATPDRIPELAEKIGVAEMGKILMAELTRFTACYTVVRPMSSEQIAQCALALISSSEEDYLSLPDLVLFFEGAKQGKYGRVLDHIDQHVIFEMLEVYRQERHIHYLNVKREREAQNSTSRTALGRSSEDNKDEIATMREVMLQHYKSEIEKNEKDV